MFEWMHYLYLVMEWDAAGAERVVRRRRRRLLRAQLKGGQGETSGVATMSVSERVFSRGKWRVGRWKQRV